MITTRQTTGSRQIYTQDVGGVAVLDRQETFVENNTEEDVEVARQRMSANLERLLNYDKYIETEKPVQAVGTVEKKSEVVEDVKTEEYTQNDADITPTDTTMQFGEMDGETIRAELRVEEEEEKEETRSRGKTYLIIYSIIITVVMALIIMNTSVLASISASAKAKQERLTELKNTYSELKAEYDEISSDEHVINVATGEYNMVK